MAPFLSCVGSRLKRLLFRRVPVHPPKTGQVMAGLSILGLLGLVYLYGAAVMYFQLPSSDFLDKAFGGAKAWLERGRSTIPMLSSEAEAVIRPKEGVSVDRAGKTADGFTLYTLTEGARASLVDMRGTVVHRWELPFSRAWTHATHVEQPLPDEHIYWVYCHLYPNGDLLAVYQSDGD